MTLKTNGCIIFIAALTPTRILVTSKHSTGHIECQEVSDAEMGEKWLDKHLEAVGKSKEQLAHTLWENRWTAVAEASIAFSFDILINNLCPIIIAL